MNTQDVTQSDLKELFSYNESTGDFTRLKSGGGRNNKIGAIAGCLQNKGYVHISIKGKLYLAHRLAWLYTQGQWPEDQIDHVNGIRNDNRVSNLREATQSQNQANTGSQTNSKSGVKGVSWHKAKGKWQAQISINSKLKYLGYFTDINEAAQAYHIAAEHYHGEFANHG